jgi:hypothetical protein
MLRISAVVFVLATLSACHRAPAELAAQVETTFELFPGLALGSAPWRCAVALPTIQRRADAMRNVLGADNRVIPLEYLTASEALEAVAAGFEHFETPTMRDPEAGLSGIRDVIDAGVPAIVPFRVPAGARAVLVAGYRTVEAPDGSCSSTLQDILVVDTVDVIAYGMAVSDFESQVASSDVLAVLTADAAVGPLIASGFIPR